MRDAWLIAGLLGILAGEVRAEEPPTPPQVPELTVVVTGTRTPRRISEDPVGTEVIGATELAARNVRDASRALEAEPGIQTERSFRGSSFQLRGFDAKYVRILVDGLPVTGQVNDVIDLRRYAMEGVERIEIVRGATSSLYGSDALAGVVNLISRRPKRPLELAGFAQYGMLNQSVAGLTAGTRKGDVSGSLSLNWFGNDSYDLTPGDENLATNGDSRRAGIATGRLFWSPSERVELSAMVRAGFFDSRGVDLQPPRALFNRRVGEDELSGAIQGRIETDEATRISFSLLGNGFWRDFWRQQRQGPGLDDMQSLETLLRSEVQVDRKIVDTEAAVGAGVQRGSLTSPRLEGGNASVVAGWLFAQAEAMFFDRLQLIAGGRLDLDQTFGVHVSPRIAMRLHLMGRGDGLALRASYGEGFRAPSFGERFLAFHNQVANYVVYGNTALRPEVSRGGQLSLEWTPAKVAALGRFVPSARVTGHFNALQGIIQPREMADSTLVEQRFQYVNYDTGRIAGIEAALRGTWNRNLIADLGFAWLDAQATVDGQRRYLPGRAARQATLSVIARAPSWGTELSVRQQVLVGRSALADDTRLPALYLADVKVSQRVWRNEKTSSDVEAYVLGENLANQNDLAFLALPGRLVTAGVAARY